MKKLFGNPETTPGGRALKFYSTIRLEVRRSTQIKDGTDVTGNLTKVKVVKNKVAPPFKVAEIDIMYGKGVSQTGEILDLGAEQEIIRKAGAFYYYDDVKIGQGREKAKEFLDDPENADMRQTIYEKVRNAFGIGDGETAESDETTADKQKGSETIELVSDTDDLTDEPIV